MTGEDDRSDWCSYGCDPAWIGDGNCDASCNNSECGHDSGDCGDCAPWCFNDWVGNGSCDYDCNNEECNFDDGDCEIRDGDCAAGCASS